MKRLLLVEFFRGALRRDERSMFFPFLQGLAREAGVETLWLCYGGAVAPASEMAASGRTLRAVLPEADRRSLARRLARFRPTHAITNDVLDAETAALLPARRLVMPMFGELAAPAPGGVARDDFARCGWFLDWLGEPVANAAGRYLIERAVPDYDAVLANKTARAAPSQLTVVSGVLCANRRALAGNPSFAAPELDAAGHLGCSFCNCATIPLVTSGKGAFLPLIETQLRRIAKASGRERRYELYDIRAFLAFDKLFELILRLKLPPSIFLFNPRIDDVLRARGRIERTLPRIAKAGHEVRILSMGVENFSEDENERLNKMITLAQVDEFLALTKSWSRSYPRVFKPFKGGYDAAELGFILFTPWTRLADLRVNLPGAAARGFPGRGYWLYSILLLETTTPIYRLARKDGLLWERYPDRGQFYGLFKNEGDMEAVTGWRFRDPKVADLFAVLVRVSAADRDGAEAPFFRGDSLFALAAGLYLPARAKTQVTPLQVALELLELLEAPGAAPSREALLREAVARASVAAAIPVPRPLSDDARAVEAALARLRGSAAFSGVEFAPITEVGDGASRRLRLALRVGVRRVVVDLLGAKSKSPCFLRSRLFRAVFLGEKSGPSPREQALIEKLLPLLDAAVAARRASLV